MGFGFETLIDKSFIIAISIPIFLRFVKIFKRRQALMCLSSVSPQVILAYLVFLSALATLLDEFVRGRVGGGMQ